MFENLKKTFKKVVIMRSVSFSSYTVIGENEEKTVNIFLQTEIVGILTKAPQVKHFKIESI